MELAVFLEPFNRGDLFARDLPDRHRAGTRHLPVDEHRTRTALRLTAAIFRACEIEKIAQHSEQTRLRIDVYRQFPAVHVQRANVCHIRVLDVLCWPTMVPQRLRFPKPPEMR